MDCSFHTPSKRPGPLATAPTKSLLLAFVLIVCFAGCNQDQPANESFPQTPDTGGPPFADETPPPVRSTVELPSATAVLDDQGIVRFDIQYRFTSGRPRGYYLVNIAFPGTQSNGVKPMEARELTTEGTITTRIEVGDSPVDAFEITMSETDSPDQGYFLISETLTGNVQRPNTAVPDESAASESDSTAEPPVAE